MEEAKDDIQLYLSEPQKFFEKISNEGLGKAIIVYLIASVIGVTLSIVINFSMTSFSNSYYSLMSMTFIAIALPVLCRITRFF